MESHDASVIPAIAQVLPLFRLHFITPYFALKTSHIRSRSGSEDDEG
jgi:hypothetical protein